MTYKELSKKAEASDSPDRDKIVESLLPLDGVTVQNEKSLDRILDVTFLLIKTKRNKAKFMLIYSKRKKTVVIEDFCVFLRQNFSTSGLNKARLVNSTHDFITELQQGEKQVFIDSSLMECNQETTVYKIAQDHQPIYAKGLGGFLSEKAEHRVVVTETERGVTITLADDNAPTAGQSLADAFQQFPSCDDSEATHFWSEASTSKKMNGIFVDCPERLRKQLVKLRDAKRPFNVCEVIPDRAAKIMVVLRVAKIEENTVRTDVIGAGRHVMGERGLKNSCLLWTFSELCFHVYFFDAFVHPSECPGIIGNVIERLTKDIPGTDWTTIIENVYEKKHLTVPGSGKSSDGNANAVIWKESGFVTIERSFPYVLVLTSFKPTQKLSAERNRLYFLGSGLMRSSKVSGNDWIYKKGEVLKTENPGVEFDSFAGASLSELPQRVVEKAAVFITGCLNSRFIGVIFFGVADKREQNHKFSHQSDGEVIGLCIDTDTRAAISDKINEMLDNFICTHLAEPLSPSEKSTVSFHFTPVIPRSKNQLYVVEVQVNPEWIRCEGRTYMCKTKSSDDFRPYICGLIGKKEPSSHAFAQHSKEIQTEYNKIVELEKEGKLQALPPFIQFV